MHQKLLVALAVTFAFSLAVHCNLATAANPPPGVDLRSLDGKVLLATDQIRSYDWATHTLTLAPKARKDLSRQLPRNRIVAGIPFAVAVGGKSIYQGTFTTVISSYSFSTPVIVMDVVAEEEGLRPDQIRIQLGYPTAAFHKGVDPRPDGRIRDALKATGKLDAARTEAGHTQWVAQSLREMQAVKPGMTRVELLKVFQEEGGLSNRITQRYAYRDCPYIKVNVTFEPVGSPKDLLLQSPEDRITRISTPFLEWSMAD